MKLKKSWILIAAVTLLLTFTVSGTVAWLADSTGELVNTFTPGTVDTEVDEPNKTEQSKPEIYIKNKGSVDVYVRVAIVANWVKDGKVVAKWEGPIVYDTAYWTLDGGYYYYNKVLPANADTARVTDNLLKNPITYDSDAAPVEEAELEVMVIHQSIQADGWPSTVTNAQQAFAEAAKTPATTN